MAKQLAEVAKNGGYDLILTGRESIDYNGGMVPGMMAAIFDYNFVNGCIALGIDGTSATVSASREIDGGNEKCYNRITSGNCRSERIGRRERFENSEHARNYDGKKKAFKRC